MGSRPEPSSCARRSDDLDLKPLKLFGSQRPVSLERAE
jgi:hypothetical protein